MNKFGFNTDKSNISFESHLLDLKEDLKIMLIILRDLVLSLGDNVIEEIRPHRIVYAKSLTFRYFLDVYPRPDNLVISIRKNRKESPKEYIVKDRKEMKEIETEIAEAYKEI